MGSRAGLLCHHPRGRCFAAPDPGVLGYVRDARFHPLVLFDGHTLDTAGLAEVPLAGRAGTVIGDASLTFVLESETDYEDPYSDKPGRFAAVHLKAEQPVLFARVGEVLKGLRFDEDTALARTQRSRLHRVNCTLGFWCICLRRLGVVLQNRRRVVCVSSPPP